MRLYIIYIFNINFNSIVVFFFVKKSFSKDVVMSSSRKSNPRNRIIYFVFTLLLYNFRTIYMLKSRMPDYFSF